MSISLVTDQDITSTCQQVLEKFTAVESYKNWQQDLRNYLKEVANTTRESFDSPQFQRRLWNDETISSTGNGNVNVDNIVADPNIADFFWQLKSCPSPEDPAEKTAFLVRAWDECCALIAQHSKRVPRLKMCRLFAALHPGEFTTVAHDAKLRTLARAMAIPQVGKTHFVVLHRLVLDRLTQALGPASGDGIERMTLPWLLYAAKDQEQPDSTQAVDASAGKEKLKPLPAAGRRRGMLAIGGYLPSIIGMLQFAHEGCNRADLRDHIKSLNKNLATGSINTNINALVAEWGALRATGDQFELTPRGEALLETQDPAEVQDWLLTRILGFDNLLLSLQDRPLSVNSAVQVLQEVNPGWTSDFAPKVLINWIRALDLAEFGPDKKLLLTEDGRSWVERIDWEPEKLPGNKTTPSHSIQKELTQDTADLPQLAELIKAFPVSASFSPTLITQLHAGLWLNERRHFAVLTGLSGAGKTLLARSYGKALACKMPMPEDGLCTVPVQPGWHDPSSLLGYKNPLIESDYVRTEFLEFLLRASGNPTRPYTVVLDEMNLSHPEQYLAPLLSAMETGDSIVLHTEEEEISGVPPHIPYPDNLVIIGTVNMDETTHGLSDKVLDRASVIEFWEIKIEEYPHWENHGLNAESAAQVREILVKITGTLSPVRLHFGWRTVGDILGYVQIATSGDGMALNQAIDYAIYAKVLPKLRGEDNPHLRKAFADATTVLGEAGLTESKKKLESLLADLKNIGTARFWR